LFANSATNKEEGDGGGFETIKREKKTWKDLEANLSKNR
jgi:hypothetical protein